MSRRRRRMHVLVPAGTSVIPVYLTDTRLTEVSTHPALFTYLVGTSALFTAARSDQYPAPDHPLTVMLEAWSGGVRTGQVAVTIPKGNPSSTADYAVVENGAFVCIPSQSWDPVVRLPAGRYPVCGRRLRYRLFGYLRHERVSYGHRRQIGIHARRVRSDLTGPSVVQPLLQSRRYELDHGPPRLGARRPVPAASIARFCIKTPPAPSARPWPPPARS